MGTTNGLTGSGLVELRLNKEVRNVESVCVILSLGCSSCNGNDRPMIYHISFATFYLFTFGKV